MSHFDPVSGELVDDEPGAELEQPAPADADAAGDDTSDVDAEPADDGAADVDDSEQEAAPVHDDVEDFYRRAFGPLYALHDPSPGSMQSSRPAARWCPTWTEHEDVVARLTAIWFAWETAHEEGGAAPAAWIRDHADYTYRWCMDDNGPFRRCKDSHYVLQPFPVDAPPTPR